MDIESLDRLDEQNRMKDLNNFIEQLSLSESEVEIDSEDRQIFNSFHNSSNNYGNSGKQYYNHHSNHNHLEMNMSYIDPHNSLPIDNSTEWNRFRDIHVNSADNSRDDRTLRNDEGHNDSVTDSNIIADENIRGNYSATNDSELEALSMLRRGNGSEAVERLVLQLHDKSIENRAIILQLNHVKLQLQALLSQDHSHRSERETLYSLLAQAEQDKLLLEAKVQDIANFERTGNENLEISELRGSLLDVANDKIMHLTSELNESNQRLYEAQSTYGDQLRQLDAERSALREEVSHIAEQLAQRAVLYAAQERRFLDNSRIYQSQYSEQSHEVVGLRARLQQLEEQHQRLENDRLNKELENRQLKDDNSRLQMQVVELQERVFTLDSEIADISAQNITMQATVERLRGSDVEELEVNLTRELEIMRVESRLREEALTKQLEEANRRVESCVVEKESLLDDLQHFRKELHAKDSLISCLEASRQYGNYLITNNTSNLKHELNYSNVQSTSIITSTQNKSASLANLLGENSTIEQQSLYGLSQERSVAVDSSFDAWSINDLFRPTVTSPSRENKIMSHSGIGLDTEYRNLRSSEDDEVVLSNDSLDLKRQEGADLRGEISALDFEISSDESSCEERVPQKQRLKSNNNSVIATEDNLLPSSDAFNSILRKISGTDGDGCNFLERSITRGEFSSIDDRPPRETTEGLKKEVQSLKSLLAIVLERASQISSHNMNSEKLTNVQLETLKSKNQLLSDQLLTYQEELQHMTELAEQNRQVGITEASSLYEEKVAVLEKQIEQYCHQQQELMRRTIADNANLESSKLEVNIKEKDMLIGKLQVEIMALTSKFTEKIELVDELNKVIVQLKQENDKMLQEMRTSTLLLIKQDNMETVGNCGYPLYKAECLMMENEDLTIRLSQTKQTHQTIDSKSSNRIPDMTSSLMITTVETTKVKDNNIKLMESIAKLKGEYANQLKVNLSKEVEIYKHSQTIEKLQRELNDQKRINEQLQSVVDETKSSIGLIQNELLSYSKTEQELHDAIASYEVKIEEYQQELSLKLNIITTQEDALYESQQKLLSLRKAKSSCDSDLAQQKQKNQSLQENIVSLIQKVGNLEEQIAALPTNKHHKTNENCRKKILHTIDGDSNRFDSHDGSESKAEFNVRTDQSTEDIVLLLNGRDNSSMNHQAKDNGSDDNDSKKYEQKYQEMLAQYQEIVSQAEYQTQLSKDLQKQKDEMEKKYFESIKIIEEKEIEHRLVSERLSEMLNRSASMVHFTGQCNLQEDNTDKNTAFYQEQLKSVRNEYENVLSKLKDDHTKELQAITSFLKNEFKKEMKKKVTKAESDYKESLLELRQEFELYKLNSLASTSSNHSHAGAEGGITTEFRDKTKGNSNIAIIASFPVGNSADSGSVKSAGIQFPEVSQYDFPSVIKPKAFEEKKKETENNNEKVASALLPTLTTVEYLNDTIKKLENELHMQKHMLQERYRAKLQKQKDSFRKEKEEMVRLVKRECEEIVLETHNLILKQRKVPSDPTHKNRIEPERVENDNNSHISRKSKSKPYSRGSSVPMLITSLTTAGADVVAHLANQHSAIQYNPATVASTNISDDKNEREKPSDKADGNNPQQRIDLNSPKLSDFSPERNFDENNFTTLKNDNRRPTIKSGTNSRNLLGSEDLPGPFPLDESVNSSLSINKGRFDSKRNSNELVRRSAEPVVYPEMISPEETLKLIQNIVHRSLTDQDVQQFFSG